MSHEKSSRFIQQLAVHKSRFHRLESPEDLGRITVYDVWRADNPEAHLELVQDWAICLVSLEAAPRAN